MKRRNIIVLSVSICAILIFCIFLMINKENDEKDEQEENRITYELPDEYPDSMGIKVEMSIKQVEGLEYSIKPMGEIIGSEPAFDWGIKIYFTEDHLNYFYFYGSYSPDGINFYPDGLREFNYIEINEKNMAWGVFDGRVLGSYKVTTVTNNYRILFEIDESVWNENKDLIIDLVESARIDKHMEYIDPSEYSGSMGSTSDD